MKLLKGIHSSALIGENVKLGKNVNVGPNSIIYENVEIGDDSDIGANVVLGEPLGSFYHNKDAYVNPRLVIGKNALVRSGTKIYAGSTLGDKFECGHNVTIRENTTAGFNWRVGTLSDIQGHCEIGDYVRFHSNVHIGHKSKIGNFVWIFPYVVLTNDPHPPSNELVGVTVDEFAVIATMSVILPGVRVGKNSLIGAGSIVKRDVEEESVVVGNPAKPVCSIRDIKSKSTELHVYPWAENFDRGMTWEGIGFSEWKKQNQI